MVKLTPPSFHFCPFCGQKLETKKEEVYRRKFCSACQWTYYPQVFTSVGAVILKKNQILLVKRRRRPYQNTWMMPGGFVEYGEHPETTLKREVKEETGLKFIESKYFCLLESNDDPRAPGNLVLFYLVKTIGEKLKTDKKENFDIGWFDLKKLPPIGFQVHRQVIKLLQKQRLKRKL
jgi:8-oxo-dGTP diphosphatase